MKKQFSMIAAAMALLMGVTSCSKDNGGTPESTGNGMLKVSFGFSETPQGRAAVSTAKPTTDWTNNIKNLQLVLASGNIVKYVQPVTVPTTGAAITPSQTFTGVPAGTYSVYLVANNNQSGNPLEAGAMAGTTTAINVGDNIDSKLVNMAAGTALGGMTEPVGAVLYKEPSEIFVAKHPATVTIADANVDLSATPLELTRVVGIVRVLIDKSHTAAANVDFTHANASFRIRNHAKAWSIGLVTPSFEAVRTNGTLISAATKHFSATEPANGYSGGTILGGDFTNWMDMICLPGGHATTGAEKFNIVISGQANAGYITSDGTALAADGPVFWQGQVSEAVLANGILELQVKITTPGTGGPDVPPVTTYGSLTITTDVKPWGNIVSTVVPL